MALYPFGDFITTIRNKFALRVKDTSKVGDYPINVYEKVEQHPNDGNNLVFESDKPIRLDSLIFSSTSEWAIITIYQISKDGHWEPVGDLSAGGGRMPFRIQTIVNENSSFWEVNSYEGEKYKVSLRNELFFPYGVRIAVGGEYLENPIDIYVRAHGVVFDD